MAQPCPICKEVEFTTLFDRQLRNRIFSLPVSCPMESKGCKWQGKYEDLQQHLNVGKIKGECPYISIPCPFKCDSSFLRRHLTRHMTKECKKRQDQCQACYGCNVQSGDGTGHASSCPNRPVDCPNGCPITDIRFCDLAEHTSQLCPFRQVECKFSQFGCQTVFKFRDGPRHYIEKVSDHLELVRKFTVHHAGLEEVFLQLAERNSELEHEHLQLQNKVDKLEEKCVKLESTIAELKAVVESVRLPLMPLNPVNDGWAQFPGPFDSAHFEPLAPPPSRRDSAMKEKEDPFCYRP